MKKIFLFISLLFLVFAPFVVNAADTTTFYTISANPGEDASHEMRINWHTNTNVIDSYVVYTKKSDTTWENSKIVFGTYIENRSFTSLNGSGEVFNQNGAVISDLEEATEYMYKITDGKTESEVRYFKTGGSNFSFIWTSDFHAYYDDGRRLTNATNNINEAIKINGGVDFIFSTGDTIAYGGTYKWWKQVSEASWMKNYMYVDTLGNHDWMTSKGTTVALGASHTFFSACHNNPKNGYAGMENVCYYFYYGDALFICMNTEEYSEAQYNWCKNVLKNNKAQYLFLFQHYEMFTGVGTKKSSGYTRWHNLCDEYGVDIFFSGNSHIYVRSKSIYKDEVSTDPSKGTVYMVAPSSDGDRGQDPVEITNNNDILACNWAGGVSQVACSIVNVTKTGVNTKLINKGGAVLDYATIPAKRPQTTRTYKSLEGFDKEALEKSITFQANPNDLVHPRIRYSRTAFDSVRAIKVSDTNNPEVTYHYSAIESGSQYITMEGFPKGQRSIDISLEYYDNTVKVITLEINNQIKWGYINNLKVDDLNEIPILTWQESIDTAKVKSLDVYVNDTKKESISIGTKKANLDGLIEGEEAVITMKIVAIDDEVLYYQTIKYTPPIKTKYYTVKFIDDLGNVLSEAQVEENTSAIAPEAPVKEGYEFVKWDKEFNRINCDLVVVSVYSVINCLVTFKDDLGNVLYEETVKYGQSANPPQNTSKEGYTFISWDKEFTNVKSNLVVTAIYEKNIIKYLVRFLVDNIEIYSVEVEEGKDVTPPVNPTKEGYSFVSWDNEFTNIQSNLDINALFEPLVKTYTVTFVDDEGKEITKVTVNEGEKAASPANPVKEGYTFKGWNVNFDNVINDMTVKAIFEKNPLEYTVTFANKDGSIITTVKVLEGEDVKAPNIPELEGFTFVSWDKELTNITSDITITAVYEEVKSDGCNSLMSLLSSITLLGIVFLFRRKSII